MPLLPNKKTRILIYCNNNFLHPSAAAKPQQLSQPPTEDDKLEALEASITEKGRDNTDEEEIIAGTTVKKPPLALNIPTFINLHGYGYENVYELADLLPIDDPRWELEGTGIKRRKIETQMRTQK